MAAAIALNLKPGGRMVMTVSEFGNWPGVDYSTYGMVADIPAPIVDGAPYRITFPLDEDTFTLVNYAHLRQSL